MPESPNHACIPILDCVIPLLESPNCVFEVFLSDSDCESGSNEVEVDPGGVSTTVQPCRFLPLAPSPVKRMKELKLGKLYKNNN